MKSVYRIAFENNLKGYDIKKVFRSFLLFSLIPIITILLSFFISSFIYWISIPLSIIYLSMLFYFLFHGYLSEVRRLKGVEEFLKDGKHTLTNYSGTTILNKLNGKRHGHYQKKSRGGTLKLSAHYKNGNLDGNYFTYHDNAKVELKASYINGNLDGPYVTYDSNGNILHETYFKNGLQHGDSLSYLSNGKLIRKSRFNNGNYEGEIIEYHSNGNIRMIQNDSKYVFYNKNEIKVCDIDIEILNIKTSKNSKPVLEKFKLKNIWTQYKENGIDIDYQIEFSGKENNVWAFLHENLDSINSKTKEIACDFIEFFFLQFHNKFVEERLRLNYLLIESGVRIIGPPGFGGSNYKKVEIKAVESLKDIVEITERNK